MKSQLIPIGEASTQYESIALSLTPALALPNNADIDREFPGTTSKLGSTILESVDELSSTAERCQQGQHEVFVVFAGSVAVGLSWITTKGTTPDSVEDKASPNVSGFIANPWRRNGYGIQSLLDRLDIVRRNFNGSAWTLVDKQNTASEKMVTRSGFKKMPEDSSVDSHYNLFVYE